MTKYELLYSLHGISKEFRKIELGRDLDKYHSKENYYACIAHLADYGCGIDDIYVTDAMYNNVYYAEPENGVYIELYPFTPELIDILHLERIPELRKTQNKHFINHQYSLYYWQVPKALRVYDFERRIKEIPDEYIPKTWLDIYTSVDYGLNNWDPDILAYVFSLIPRRTDNDYITVYRGEGTHSTAITQALSWTTDINIALWFAVKGEGSRIWKGQVQKKNILFSVTERNEHEVILHPGSIENLAEMDMYSGDKNTILLLLSSVYEQYLQFGTLIRKAFDEYHNNSILGREHAARVMLNCLLISNENDWVLPEEVTILAIASVFHDISRIDEGRNKGHGIQSAKIMTHSALLDSLDESTKKVIAALIAAHDMSDEQGYDFIRNSEIGMDKDRVIELYQILKDADVLDRVRLGGYRYEFDYNYLRLDGSKRLVLLTAALYYHNIHNSVLDPGYGK